MKFGVRFSYLLPMEPDEVIEDGLIVVEDDRIIYSGSYKETGDIPVIDTRPSIGMPTLINTHTHTAMVAYRGLADDLPLFKWLQEYIWPAESKTVNEEMVSLSFKLAIAEMINGGTGAINDMYFFQEVAAEVMEEIGFRGLLGEGLIDFPTPSFKTPDEGIKKVENQLRMKNMYKFARFSVCLHAPYSCSPDLIIKGYEIAKEYDVPLHMHVAETLNEVQQITEKYRKRPVEYLESLGILHDKFISAHSVHLSDNEIEIFKERNVKVAHDPQSNMKLSSGIAPVDRYIKKGITVGLATDGAASNNDLDMFEEMRTAALLHKVRTMDPEVMNAKAVVRMATIESAKVIGFDDIIGSLKVGKKADFIVISLESPHMQPIYDPYSHIVYTAKSSDVKWVFIDGKPLKKEGKLTFISDEEVREIGMKLKDMVLNSLK